MATDIDALLDALTLDEKIQLVHGDADPNGRATGYVPGIDRLDIPPLRLVDGPLGVRAIGEQATAFPASIALAASWDPELATRFGRALAEETAAHEQDVVLAPGVNIVRVPQGGRNFEYYSEDPHLAARTAAGTVSGVESENVGATVKHYVANNQETNRYEVSAEMSERALREVYLPPFRAAVEDSGATAVMTAYNQVNGTSMSDHEYLISDVLRDEWDFDGLVMSDWWGTRSTVQAARAGLDLEMPGIRIEQFVPDETEIDFDAPETPDVADQPPFFGDRLRDAVESGTVAEGVIDRKVRRILQTMHSLGRFEGQSGGAIDTPEHRALAREIAIEGAVLLRNDGVLPLAGEESLALLGPHADSAKIGGGGSSEVSPVTQVSPLEELQDRIDVTDERGVEPIGESSTFKTDDGPSDGEADFDAAIEAAAAADVAIVVAQDDATEFVDRNSLGLPGRQDELIEAVADTADHTVVVLRTSGPVEMPWLDAVDAVLETWYPGQADGEALAQLLFGDAEPGGRLPVTFGYSVDDYPTGHERTFPGTDGRVHYDEGVFVGYRYFDREGIDPAFAFGHGRSYAEFTYGDSSVDHETDGVTVSVPVENTGGRAGKTVVQVYARKTATTVETPDRELVGFRSVELDAGERREVAVSIAEDELAYYDEQSGWTIPRGTNELLVGQSSRSIEGTLSVEL